jgi:hypothetical protein
MQMSPEELERRRAAANPPKAADDELLETGQEEVFSRTEVESGRTEHQDQAGKHTPQRPNPADWAEPESDEIRRDEEQTERQAPNDASPGEAGG